VGGTTVVLTQAELLVVVVDVLEVVVVVDEVELDVDVVLVVGGSVVLLETGGGS
jgi:hypothetical protein